jgi:uracil-DNA glycosylase family 4
MHGANATGRPFTGDHAGLLLYQTLYDYGFSSQPESTSRKDGLALYNCRITNAVKCLPPQNKPLGAEVNQCNDLLAHELSAMPMASVVIALGSIAHKAVVKALQLRQKDYPFAHAMEHQLSDQLKLIDSYHCSRYNTQTRRLTTEMFQGVFQRAAELLD